MAAYRAIIFDLDGTLVDSYEPISASVNAARSHFDLVPIDSAEIREAVGHGLESLLETFLGSVNVDVGVRVFREKYASVFLTGTKPLVHAIETIAWVARSGRAVGVASNKPSRFSRPILEHLGFQAHVSFVLGPDEGIPPKPHPAMLAEAGRLTHTTPEETLYVGDMPLDVETARQARVDHVLVPTGGASLATLREIPGARVLSGIDRLMPFLGDPASD